MHKNKIQTKLVFKINFFLNIVFKFLILVVDFKIFLNIDEFYIFLFSNEYGSIQSKFNDAAQYAAFDPKLSKQANDSAKLQL